MVISQGQELGTERMLHIWISLDEQKYDSINWDLFWRAETQPQFLFDYPSIHRWEKTNFSIFLEVLFQSNPPSAASEEQDNMIALISFTYVTDLTVT